jgi:hypothetical protein
METFPYFPDRISTGKLFPEEIETRAWVAYHATSSYHAPAIERNGFVAAKIIPETDLDLIVRLGRAYGIEVDAVSQFRGLRTVSLSPSSLVSWSYTRGDVLGGQGLKFVNELAEKILEQHGSAMNARDVAQVRSITQHVSAVRGVAAVVYAVDLEGLTSIEFQHATRAIHARPPIPSSRIIGKIVTANSGAYPHELVNAARDGMMDRLNTDSSWWLRQIYDRPDRLQTQAQPVGVQSLLAGTALPKGLSDFE